MYKTKEGAKRVGVAETGGKMMEMLCASPPAGRGGRRKKEGRSAEMTSLCVMYVGDCSWLIF